MAAEMNTPTPAQMAAVGAAIADARRTTGMSQADLGAAVNIKQAQISALESGKRPITLPQEIFAIEKALTVPPGTISWHLGYTPVGTPPSVLAAVKADTELDEASKATMSILYVSMTS